MMRVSRAEFDRYPGVACSVGSAIQNGCIVAVRITCMLSIGRTWADVLGTGNYATVKVTNAAVPGLTSLCVLQLSLACPGISVCAAAEPVRCATG